MSFQDFSDILSQFSRKFAMNQKSASHKKEEHESRQKLNHYKKINIYSRHILEGDSSGAHLTYDLYGNSLDFKSRENIRVLNLNDSSSCSSSLSREEKPADEHSGNNMSRSEEDEDELSQSDKENEIQICTPYKKQQKYSLQQSSNRQPLVDITPSTERKKQPKRDFTKKAVPQVTQRIT